MICMYDYRSMYYGSTCIPVYSFIRHLYMAICKQTNKYTYYTPWKINMEPTNHQFRKENDLPNLQGIMFHVNLQGVSGGAAHL